VTFSICSEQVKRVNAAPDHTPLDEGSARRRDLYLTTHDIHKRQTSMSLGRIRTRKLNKCAAAHLSVTTSGQRERQRT